MISLTTDQADPLSSAQSTSLRDRVLSSVTSVQDAYIAGRPPGEVFDGLLSHVLELTDSEYGYIGEVLHEDGVPFLKAYAMTDISWDKPSREIYEQAMLGGGFEFRNMQSLFGAVLVTGEPVIANDAPNDPRAAGTMRGHLPLDRYLGLPLFSEGELVGSVGVSNRPGGYDEALVEELRPFLATCGNLVRAFRERRLRLSAEDAATSSRMRLQTIVDAAEEGILTLTDDGMVATSNPSAVAILGVDPAGASFLERVAPEDLDRARDAMAASGGRTVRLRLLREDGSNVMSETSFSSASTPEGLVLVAIIRDATTAHETEQALLRARDEAERLNRAKNDFLAAMSHELRTPLNGVLGMADLLLTAAAGPLQEQQAEWVGVIHSSGSHLLAVINDVLDLAKIEADRLELATEDVDIAAVVHEAVQIVQAAPEVAGRTVDIDVKGEQVVRGDPRRLRQVVINLLSNAAKFTEAPDAFGIVVGPGQQGGARIEVWDNGPGIPADALERIFEPFEQLDSTASRSEPGTGLGLPLSSRLVAAHGGTLHVETTLGHGSRFIVDLPAT